METIPVPIVCKKCNRLALAYFDGVPLCPKCLTGSVGRSTDPFAVGRIRPLWSSNRELKGLIKCKRNSAHAKDAAKRRDGSTAYSL